MEPIQVSRLSQLLSGLVEVPDELDLQVQDLVSDSREVTPGALFIALPGISQDGRQFVENARSRGAVAVVQQGNADRAFRDGNVTVVELVDVRQALATLAVRFFDDPCKDLCLIGVTGTNGKSSVTHFIAQLLTRLGQPCGVIGTLGYGLPGQLREASHTTPDTVRLFRELARMRQDGAQAVAMEVSSHALDQNRIAGLKFRGGVFTNLTRDHLDYHGDMEAYGRAKKRLFERSELEFAVVNLDDDFGRQIIQGHPAGCPMTGFALRQRADLQATDIHYRHQGFEAKVHYRGTSGTLSCGLIGDFNLSNVLAAIGVLLSLGHPLEVTLQCAENLQPVPGRMQSLQVSRGPVVIVDYAHTPDALEQALRACALHLPDRIWCVFGCGGDRDRGKRPLMAAVAARHGAHLVVTDDNPRTESPEQIVRDILEGIPQGVPVQVMHDREQAIAWAISQAGGSDIVLIAGKGHEPYQEIQGVRRPFSDMDVADRYLRQWESAEVGQ